MIAIVDGGATKCDWLILDNSGKEIIRELSKTKKMNPGLKKKIGKEISLEAIADLILPTPLSLAFHVYQLLLLAKA